MCGINGILRLDSQADPIDREELVRTRDFMTKRGPDSAGEWISPSKCIGLGHRRLAIIDLSPSGDQPMEYEDGRYRITFNGEIYNYRELRTKLESKGVRFRSQSDTEVVLALYARDGIGMLSCLRGMYALAIWDEQDRRLLLARDPLGIKPLYYGIQDGVLRFASQVKALEASGAISLETDPAGVVGFLLWGSVPEPITIRRSIRALPAGHHIVVQNGCVGNPKPHDESVTDSAHPHPDVASSLEESVRAHFVSDVPVAIFLSAGLDSSLITALACRFLREPPITLTLRFKSFKDTPWDEAPLAAEIARRLGTRHIEKTIGRDDFPELFPQAIAAMDQPTIDGFNVYAISKIANQTGLKVVISGLGGDELFGGYPSFHDVPQWTRWANLPLMARLDPLWRYFTSRLYPSRPKLTGLVRHGKTLQGAYFLRRALFLPEELPHILGQDFTREGIDAYNPIDDASKFLDLSTAKQGGNGEEVWQKVHIMETTQYLRNQLLRDADWASMAHSIELRVPLVDHWLSKQLSELSYEPARSQGKAALVRRVVPELPEKVLSRKKSGFLFPIMEWLDEGLVPNRRWGADSRKVALRVLQEFI
jgi:asparagine synthase (glutamine-hydrolysing)